MDPLNNLVNINQLKVEPPDANEIAGLIRSAKTKLNDIQSVELSKDSRFILAYGSAHSLALAALRWRGYRANNRSIVFQCVSHTLDLPAADLQILINCHRRRNIAEYEGELDIENALLKALIETANKLLQSVESLGPIAEA